MHQGRGLLGPLVTVQACGYLIVWIFIPCMVMNVVSMAQPSVREIETQNPVPDWANLRGLDIVQASLRRCDPSRPAA